MVGASFYITVCTTRNRLRLRLRRLREPRYLIGAVIGAAYLFFVFVLPRRAATRRGRGRGFPVAVNFAQAGLALGSAGLLLLAAASWFFPAASTLFAFTEAETELLFPAPVTRRQLLVHRLIRSQFGLLFAGMMPAFLIIGTASFSERVLRGLALWVSFVTFRVYFAGISMARSHLGSPDRRARTLAWAPVAITLAATAAVGIPVARGLAALPSRSFPAAMTRLGELTSTGLAGTVLSPMRMLIRPLFVQGAVPYLTAIGGSLVVLLAVVVWVLKSDEIFQHAGAETLITTAPAGRRRRTSAPRVRAAGWVLPLIGRTETVFLWKNGMRTLREINLKSLIPLAAITAYAVVGAKFWMSRGVASAVCVAALLLAAGMTLLAPGNVMSDLRGDLRHIEVLKTWPVKGSAVIRGQMLWPGSLLTVCVWFLLSCASVVSGAAFPRLGLDWRIAFGGVAFVMAPVLIFAQYLIHQAAAVLFPGWIPSDTAMRGFEMMSQRLIMFVAVVLTLIVIVGPGAIAGGIVAFAFYRVTGSPLVFIPAAAVCLAVVVIELMLATEALGPAYDRIDLSGVERGE
jgi:ABC-2 type transport system permease protein